MAEGRTVTKKLEVIKNVQFALGKSYWKLVSKIMNFCTFFAVTSALGDDDDRNLKIQISGKYVNW